MFRPKSLQSQIDSLERAFTANVTAFTMLITGTIRQHVKEHHDDSDRIQKNDHARIDSLEQTADVHRQAITMLNGQNAELKARVDQVNPWVAFQEEPPTSQPG